MIRNGRSLLIEIYNSLTDSFILAAALSGLEEAYNDPEEFRVFCRRFRDEHPDAMSPQFVQWYLEPTDVETTRRVVSTCHDDFVRAQQAAPLHSPWVWHDPFGDCSFKVENGLEIYAANGRDLWHINLSAPRILQSVGATHASPLHSFAVQTVYVPIVRAGLKPALTSRVFLRMERISSRVNALCSADDKNWFTVGQVEFPVEDPVEVGLHAIGSIDRTIYHGAFPEGTAIRFESFQLYEI